MPFLDVFRADKLINSSIILIFHNIHTVEPRFNEVPRDWGDLFVIARVRYIENLDLTNFRENNQNIRYIEVKLMINFQWCYVALTQHFWI